MYYGMGSKERRGYNTLWDKVTMGHFTLLTCSKWDAAAAATVDKLFTEMCELIVIKPTEESPTRSGVGLPSALR